MSIRTIDELKDAISHAFNNKDAAALEQCAHECEVIATTEALAFGAAARAQAEGIRGNSKVSIDHFHKALLLFTEIDDRKHIALVCSSICYEEYRAENYTVALEYGRRALELHEGLGDRRKMAYDHGNLGDINYVTGFFRDALVHYSRALTILEDLGDQRGIARHVGNIGNVYDAVGSYPPALEHFFRALAMHQENGDHYSVALVTSNIGVVYMNTGNNETSLEYLHRALSLREGLGDRRGIAYTNGNIGLTLSNMGRYSEALEYYQRALALHEELGERERAALVTGNIIHAFIRSGAVDEAEKVLVVFESANIKYPLTVIRRKTVRGLIQEYHGELDEAMKTYRMALVSAQEYGMPKSMATVHKYMRDLCQKRSDFAGYLEHNNECNRINEEINGKDATTRLAIQEAERRMAKERQEHEKHLSILHSTLPKTIADRVARGETVNDHYDNAAVLFLDIVGFTMISDQLSSDQVVQLLEQVFTTLDTVCEKHDVVKIKTIGDSYMAVAFDEYTNSRITEYPNSNCAIRAAHAALDMLHAIADLPGSLPECLRESLRETLPYGLQVRIGLHSGPVTAGVIGTNRMQYDVWGDTVNVASRMESTSIPGRIHVSEAFAFALHSETAKQRNSETDVIPSVIEEPGTWHMAPGTWHMAHGTWHLELRGETELKGKGTMTTYWLERS